MVPSNCSFLIYLKFTKAGINLQQIDLAGWAGAGVFAVADGGAVPVIFVLVLVLDLMKIFYENILCPERRKICFISQTAIFVQLLKV